MGQPAGLLCGRRWEHRGGYRDYLVTDLGLDIHRWRLRGNDTDRNGNVIWRRHQLPGSGSGAHPRLSVPAGETYQGAAVAKITAFPDE